MPQDEVSFGRFRLDLRRRTLTCEGSPIELKSKAFDILSVLASAQGNVVTKGELMAKVWPGLVVEESNIQVHISALRKALGEERDRPVHLFTVSGRGYQLVDVPVETAKPGAVAIPVLPDRPSIVVLPFTNMSGDPEQDYFADGIAEEIITVLSRFKWLFVIARNSSFTYKGKAVDVRGVGRDLGVRYALEGSVRKSGDRVRIAVQLIETHAGLQVWAERYDGLLGDIFDLQDQMTESIVGAIAPAVERAEIERAKRKPTDSLDAYTLYLRGLSKLYQFADRRASDEALRLFNSAIEIDPDFASAHGRAALCYVDAKAHGRICTANEIAEVSMLARRAVEFGKNDAIALAASGWAVGSVARNLGAGAALIDRALMLNSNLAEAWYFGGWAKVWLGDPNVAIERFAHAMRLSPLDPWIIWMRTGTAHAHFFLGRYDEAELWAAMALQDNPDFQPGLRISAASTAMARRPEETHRTVARLQQLYPALRVSNLEEVVGPYQRADDLSRYAEGLRRAGLPE
jgi:TolB-like protein